MAAIAVWLGIFSNRARRQKYVVEKVRALGGTVAYDFQKQKGGRWNDFDFKNSPPGPDWMRRFIGDDYFESVVQIGLQKTPITDSDLVCLDNLPDANALEWLNLDNTKISNDGLAHVERFRRLCGLSLWQTDIDDRGLVHLCKLTNIQSLFLDGT